MKNVIETYEAGIWQNNSFPIIRRKKNSKNVTDKDSIANTLRVQAVLCIGTSKYLGLPFKNIIRISIFGDCNTLWKKNW